MACPDTGAGAVTGYAVMRIDPAVVTLEDQPTTLDHTTETPEPLNLPAGADMASAFG